MRIAANTTIEDFWKQFPGAEEALCDLEPNGRKGVQIEAVKGLGRVEVWLDECCEGADRGGYVAWYRLCEIIGPDNQPIVLEADTDGCTIFFADRMGILR